MIVLWPLVHDREIFLRRGAFAVSMMLLLLLQAFKNSYDMPELYDLMAGKIEQDASKKEVFSKFSGVRKTSSNLQVSRNDYEEEIRVSYGPGFECALLSAKRAHDYLSRPDVRLITCHPSCLGDGYGPISLYTKRGSRSIDVLVTDASFY